MPTPFSQFGEWFKGDFNSPVPKGLGFEEWQEWGASLVNFDTQSRWKLAFWLAFGEHTFKEWWIGTAESLGLDKHTLQNYASIARAFANIPPAGTLSIGHHEPLANRHFTDDERREMLDKILKDGMSREEVREMAKARLADKSIEKPKDPAWNGGGGGKFGAAADAEEKVNKGKCIECKTEHLMEDLTATAKGLVCAPCFAARNMPPAPVEPQDESSPISSQVTIPEPPAHPVVEDSSTPKTTEREAINDRESFLRVETTPCPDCAAKDEQIKDLEEDLKRWEARGLPKPGDNCITLDKETAETLDKIVARKKGATPQSEIARMVAYAWREIQRKHG